MQAWIKRWGPVIFMMGLIFIASSIPSEQMPRVENFDTLVKKGGHMLGYALLGISLARAQGRLTWKTFWISLAVTIGFALSDEFHQSFVPGRNATLVDVGIDTTGCLLGQLLLTKFPLIQKIVFSQ